MSLQERLLLNPLNCDHCRGQDTHHERKRARAHARAHTRTHTHFLSLSKHIHGNSQFFSPYTYQRLAEIAPSKGTVLVSLVKSVGRRWKKGLKSISGPSFSLIPLLLQYLPRELRDLLNQINYLCHLFHTQ